MPSLLRFLLFVVILVGAGYSAMWTIVSFVEPQPREMSQSLPPSKLSGK